MTVKDLIEELQKFDPNMQVIVSDSDEFGYASTGFVEDVYETKFDLCPGVLECWDGGSVGIKIS